ncbi:hypothetical protein FDW83_04550 [Pseudarthrobacter sp. NamE2]|uniref:hypothetical protein n=1 Tax=Pseudarthrobacter sp. NamE2 TaxID=2576838 RepID=UPI0010FD339A|nr:hypothetical protein [Pseudarthrobacter sp. NamE2]TLM85645.1 hypothetical protein FDW83_04550 [Pseudarthrobacter sp. NamE2]
MDWAGYDALRDLLSPEAFIPFISVWRDGLPLKPNQSWLTTRFHLHFMGAAAGAVGTAISVKEGYYDVKHGSLLRLGTGWSSNITLAAGSSVTGVPETGTATFSARLGARIEQKLDEARELYPQIQAEESTSIPSFGNTAVRLLRGIRAAVTA